MRERFGSRRLFVVGILVLGSVAAFVGGALATHSFSDVPSGAFYHDDVSWLVANNITAGCGSGKYCPNNAVTRGQMATFLHAMARQTRVGHFSCDAAALTPYNSAQTWLNGLNYATSDGQMSCNVVVSDSATIREVSWSLYDNDAADAEQCSLYRRHLISSIGDSDAMASAVTSVPGTPGAAVFADTTVANAAVDNENYSYAAACSSGGGSTNVGVFGISVEYTYLGVPAP